VSACHRVPLRARPLPQNAHCADTRTRTGSRRCACAIASSGSTHQLPLLNQTPPHARSWIDHSPSPHLGKESEWLLPLARDGVSNAHCAWRDSATSGEVANEECGRRRLMARLHTNRIASRSVDARSLPKPPHHHGAPLPTSHASKAPATDPATAAQDCAHSRLRARGACRQRCGAASQRHRRCCGEAEAAARARRR